MNEPTDGEDGVYGIISSHPAACLAVMRTFESRPPHFSLRVGSRDDCDMVVANLSAFVSARPATVRMKTSPPKITNSL
jgi:hypothetical protein